MKRFINGCDAQIVPLRSNLFVPAREKKNYRRHNNLEGNETVQRRTERAHE